MEILIGTGLGLVIAAIIAAAWVGIRRYQEEEKRLSRGPSSGTKREESARREPAPNLQQVAYNELLQEFTNASIPDELTTLMNRLDRRRSSLAPGDYEGLVTKIKNGLKAFEDEARQRAASAAKVAQFRELKGMTDKVELFNTLHDIWLIRDSKLISFDELEEYGEVADIDWLCDTYDKLLIERLEGLVAQAISSEGVTADFDEARQLMTDLLDNEYESAEGEDIYGVMSNALKQQWNEMVVRFMREPDPEEDLFGYDDLGEDDYKELIRKAREGDLLSLRLVTLLSDDNYNTDFDSTLVEFVMAEFQAALDQHYLALGFQEGEDQRG